MEIDGQRKPRIDQMSDCRSFGSNCHPCSQSRKISIGVMLDSVPKSRSGPTKEDEVVMPNSEKVTSNKENSLEREKDELGVRADIRGKQTDVPMQEGSLWINTRSKAPTLKIVHNAKQTSSGPINSGRRDKFNSATKSPRTYSVQFVAEQTSTLQSGCGKQSNFDRVTYKGKGGNGNVERVENFSFATAEEILGPDKGVMEGETDKTENRSSEALKMKLWEILGSVSSPNKQFSNSQTLEVGANNINHEQVFYQKANTVVKPRQNSDTIETDSESPDHNIRRPVTRSLTRKRAPSKAQPKKNKNRPPSSYKHKHQENYTFSFEEGWSGRLHGAVNGVSLMSKMKKIKKKSNQIEPREISFLEKDNADKIPQASDRRKTPPPADRTSSLGSRMGSFLNFHQQNDREYVKSKNRIQEKDSHPSPATMKVDQLRGFDSPAVPENTDQQEDFNPSLQNITDPQDDFPSPTFGMKTPIKSSSPSPCTLPKTDQKETGFCSPAPAGTRFNVGDICSFQSWRISKPDYSGSSVQTESSDDTEELKDSPIRNSVPFKGEKDAVLSKSSSEERDSESSEGGSPIIGGYNCSGEDVTLSPETGIAEKPTYTCHPAKRLRSHEGIKFNGLSPSSPSPKGTEEGNGLQGPSEQNQEDGLSRAVNLFASALERLESKMKSVTRKKSSEILMYAAEGINLQLQNVESQIQTDVGKLKSLNKSKRKRLETRFQEQQEQLKLIHERFKKEVNQYLQDCSSTLESLESNQIEFKGTVEKQNASHRKLLSQMEEAIGTQLNDAHRRITAVHKLAREKMLQLKHVIAECLKEGVLS